MNDLKIIAENTEKLALHSKLIEEIISNPISPKEHAARNEIIELRSRLKALEDAQREAKPAKKTTKKK